jgi:hypothetical protein
MKPWILSVAFAVLMGAAGLARATGVQPAGDATAIDVYIQFDNAMWQVIWPAKTLVSEIFARIGIALIWHEGREPEGRPAFGILWAERAPMSVAPGALASARPFCSTGAAITLYEDRLQEFLKRHSDVQNIALAYVLAHELAHVMQGLERHSDSGILKPNWSDTDFRQMRSLKLAFTANDSDLIHLGIEARTSRRKPSPWAAAPDNVVSLAQE